MKITRKSYKLEQAKRILLEHGYLLSGYRIVNNEVVEKMTLLEKITAYNKAVPFICSRVDYEGAWYQYRSEYFMIMQDVLTLTKEEVEQLTELELPEPILFDYP